MESGFWFLSFFGQFTNSKSTLPREHAQRATANAIRCFIMEFWRFMTSVF
jgi:hypothetical protein